MNTRKPVALVVRGEIDDEDILMQLMEVDDDIAAPRHGFGSGSRVGKAPNVDRRRVFYSHLLFQDFWGDSPIYNASFFKRFFKVPIGLFDEIVLKVVSHDGYFRQKPDASESLVCLPFRRCVVLFDSSLRVCPLLSMMINIACLKQRVWSV